MSALGKNLLFTVLLASISFFDVISVLAAGETTAGTMTVASGNESLTISAPYAGDGSDGSEKNTLLIEWGLSGVNFNLGSDSLLNAPSPYSYTIDGLSNGTAYQVRVTWLDADNTPDPTQTLTNLKPFNKLVHSSLSTGSTKWGASGWGVPDGKYGEFVCQTCHMKQSPNIKRIKSVLTAPNGPDQLPIETGIAPDNVVVFSDTRDGSSNFGDDNSGHLISTKICEVCHSITDYHRYDTITDPDGIESLSEQSELGHYNKADCIKCHSHSNGFNHGVGARGSGCELCHGHDVGFEYSPGLFSTGAGTSQSHSTHSEIDSDDLKGPSIACSGCHDINNYPYFITGIDANNDGRFSLAETDVCNSCHSPGGSYDGIGDATIGAKKIWDTGAYTDTNSSTLAVGMEKWCATCHDESPATVNAVDAPNIVGDEDGTYTYGTGWGYYKTGHGLDAAETPPSSGGLSSGAGTACDACHDYSLAHVDGEARTYVVANDNYREGYRLKLVDGQNPMTIPLTASPATAADFRLCLGCRDANTYIEDDVYPYATNFWNEDSLPNANYHKLHLTFSAWPQAFSSDWSQTPPVQFSSDSFPYCITCHNVHGSTQLSMIRDGKLVNKEPGLEIYYNSSAETAVYPSATTLAESVSAMVPNLGDKKLCGGCHGDGQYYRLTTPDPPQAPTLAWTGEANYINDGANPDAVVNTSSVEFRVSYIDVNFEFPSSIELWVDENDNGSYELSEQHALSEVNTSDRNTKDGKLYNKIMPLQYAGDGTLNYRFYASDGVNPATGSPTSNQTITVLNNTPALDWAGNDGYVSDGVAPDSNLAGSSFQFRIKYTDADNNPPTTIQLWIDKNDDGDYLDANEKVALDEFNTFETDYTAGKTYLTDQPLTKAGDGIFKYRFYASDGQTATGLPATTDKTVTIENNKPSLSWTDEQHYTTDGVNPDSAVVTGNFEFRVTYTDADNDAPTSIQAWIDKNDDIDYLDSGEKVTLSAVDTDDTLYTDGKLYTSTIALSHAGDGKLNYRFFATDGTVDAIGSPVTDSTLNVYASNNVPDLDWTGNTGYTVNGVEPDSGSGGANFTFQVKYTDIDETAPTSIQLWIDKNDNGDFLDAGEKIDLAATDGSDTIFTDGKLYAVTTHVPDVTDGTVSYLFYAHDGIDSATGNATVPQTVNVVTPLTVCASGCGFFTIQAAIDDIGTVNGDHILVADGTYSENITFSGKDITVQSINGPSATTIQGATISTNAPVVTFDTGETANAVLDGFTVDNQAASSETRGIFIFNSHPTITNSIIQGNRTGITGGAGIYISGLSGGATIKNTIIGGTSAATGNESLSNGGGLYFEGPTSGALSIIGSVIRYNQANRGGGLSANTITNVITITDTIISNNSAVRGDGIYLTDAPVAITNSQVNNNSGEGLYLFDETNVVTNPAAIVTIDDSTFSGNGSDGINKNSKTAIPLTISNSSFTLNSGNGIYVHGSTGLTTINNTTMSNNTYSGLSISESSVMVTDSHIDNNNYSGAYLRSAFLTQTGTIANTSISNNKGSYGGGLHVGRKYDVTFTGGTINGNEATDSGGGLYVDRGVLDISKSHIRGNKAPFGGGVYVGSNSYGSVTMTNCDITGNIAENSQGAGIYNDQSTLKLYSSTVSGNVADGTFGSGAGVYYRIFNTQSPTSTIIRNSIIWGNISNSTDASGVISSVSAANTIITHSDIDYIYTTYGYTDDSSGADVVVTNSDNPISVIRANPRFVDMQQATNGNPITTGDFHLSPGSNCIDRGSAIGSPLDDIDGDARPINVLGYGDGVDDYDMGSDEYIP